MHSEKEQVVVYTPLQGLGTAPTLQEGGISSCLLLVISAPRTNAVFVLICRLLSLSLVSLGCVLHTYVVCIYMYCICLMNTFFG